MCVVHVDLGGPQLRMLGADHPQQATQPALVQIGPVAGSTVWALRVTTYSRGGSPGNLGQFAGDAHQMANVFTAARPGSLLVRFADVGR